MGVIENTYRSDCRRRVAPPILDGPGLTRSLRDNIRGPPRTWSRSQCAGFTSKVASTSGSCDRRTQRRGEQGVAHDLGDVGGTSDEPKHLAGAQCHASRLHAKRSRPSLSSESAPASVSSGKSWRLSSPATTATFGTLRARRKSTSHNRNSVKTVESSA